MSSWKSLWQKLLVKLGLGRMLCDTCRLDYGDACRRPERPNATVCSDYGPRGRS